MEKKIYSYIEIKKYEDGKVVKRINVTGKSNHNKQKLEAGMNINIDPYNYYTFSFDSETQLEVID